MATVGIDLGTTYCAVAHLDDRDRPVMIPNRDGDILTPSAIYLTDDNRAVVGQPALDLALEQPDRVATLVKRRMGFADYGRPIAGRMFRPETLSAIILKKLVQDAARVVGPVTAAVITVPAYFDDTRRKATQDAGRIAGLDVLDMIDEPSAAALAYSFQTPHGGSGEAPSAAAPRTVLVYDLGGGTFDVTLVKLGKKRFQVLGIEGDVQLGGHDFDERVVNHVANQFQAQFGVDPRTDPQSVAMLQASAERAKRTLSKLDQATVTCQHNGQKLQVPLTRTEFEALTADLLLRTKLTTQQVLDQAGLNWTDVGKVLMVGGSTHMPGCGRMLARLTGREPDRNLAVSEVVARGAAVHAGIAAERRRAATESLSPLADVVEINVNAHSLGVEIRVGDGRVNDMLIRKNTQLPARETRVYRTAKPNQQKVRVRVLQGEAHQAEACIPVGECWIDQLPPNLPLGSPVQVTCGVAANGLIQVVARDVSTGREVRATLQRQTGLSDDQIASETAYVAQLDVQ